MASTAAELAADGVAFAVGEDVADGVALAVGEDVAVGLGLVAGVDAGLDSVAVDAVVVTVWTVAVSAFGQNSIVATVPPTSSATSPTSSEISTRDRRGFALRARATAPPADWFRPNQST
jgi:hypothetical protein